jgi:hypothetical protein
MGLETLKELQKYLHVVHHVPGRLRIKFDVALAGHPRAGDILNPQNPIPGIKNVRLNMGARSVIIEYDRERIQPELLQELFTTRESKRVQRIINELTEQLA